MSIDGGPTANDCQSTLLSKYSHRWLLSVQPLANHITYQWCAELTSSFFLEQLEPDVIVLSDLELQMREDADIAVLVREIRQRLQQRALRQREIEQIAQWCIPA